MSPTRLELPRQVHCLGQDGAQEVGGHHWGRSPCEDQSLASGPNQSVLIVSIVVSTAAATQHLSGLGHCTTPSPGADWNSKLKRISFTFATATKMTNTVPKEGNSQEAGPSEVTDSQRLTNKQKLFFKKCCMDSRS
ncbi:hypothetical protein I79_005426 [Cricetulus griseus]|uniref:Uncharacterized protein n=1 Tax=Cricetulus griseus TaxID=10029 RepID=G3H555_CRIGR|nr:hypothetical protein I79_005426 [Cricetulus griseus]ERE82550.1 hypothetical protein H671_2g7350 [Cricetulus griseus]